MTENNTLYLGQTSPLITAFFYTGFKIRLLIIIAFDSANFSVPPNNFLFPSVCVNYVVQILFFLSISLFFGDVRYAIRTTNVKNLY